MLDIDILSAFVICGAASCVAAFMTVLARAEEPDVAAGLRICTAGFAVLGLSLLQLLLGVRAADGVQALVMLAGSTVGVGLFGWGLARLTGERVPPAAVLGLLVVVVVAHLLAWRDGAWTLSLAFMVCMTLVSALAALGTRRFLQRPVCAAERLLGGAMLLFAASWFPRLAWMLAYEGPVQVHHVHAPPLAANALAIFYGVMPIFLATVVLSVLNERLSIRLALRANTDELTGAMTRRALRDLAPRAIAAARSAGHDVAVLMIDLDHFKAINDRHGHLAGDDVLRRTASLLRAQLRADALVTRFGGEEFAIVLAVDGVAAARQASERLRLAVADTAFGSPDRPLAVTVSVGLAMLGPGEALDAALLRADEALYRAKSGGRNRVVASLDRAA